MENYDYVILGSGFGGLAISSLLANKGKSVCLIEANSILGGYSHTIKKGKYKFCHGVHYLMGLEDNGPMHTFFKKLNLDEKIKFNKFDENDYDTLYIDGIKFEIPLGLDNYLKKLIQLFPEHEKNLKKYFEIEKKIFYEANVHERIFTIKDVLKKPWKYLTIIKYHRHTLEDVFKKFNFPTKLRAILSARLGDLSASPNEVSFLMYAAMDVAYSLSAYYPKKGMEDLINEISKIILNNKKCKILLNTKVEEIYYEENKISKIKTNKGFIQGKTFISNIDPKKTFNLIKNYNAPYYYKKKLNYDYSDSLFSIYLGLKNFDVKNLKKTNIWHYSDLDLNKLYINQVKKNNFSKPWFFISIPSILVDENVLCPKNHATMEILTATNYDYFKKLNKNKLSYKKKVNEITNHFLDIIEEKYFPKLRNHIDEIIVYSPLEIEKNLNIPFGNFYGQRLIPKNISVTKLNSTTPIKNLFLVGATVSFPGIMGVTVCAMDLFHKLED
ncbi:MAG: phytoene desaturase family protein [Candidatus Woesearchaeota archaeon]